MHVQPDSSPDHKRWWIGGGIAVVVAALVVGALVLRDDDDDGVTTDTTTTTEAPTTTTTASTTTTTEPSFAVVDPSIPVFPDPTTSRRFDDPAPLVAAFATEMVGFVEPVLGELEGDDTSGEIEVRATAETAPTVVTVRRLEDDTWFVIGATTDAIRLASPAAGATVASPLATSGQAYAFEGHVDVRLLADGVEEPIGTGFVTGRGDGVLGDWTGDPIPFEVPGGASYGVLVLSSASGDDGSVLDATVVRVAF